MFLIFHSCRTFKKIKKNVENVSGNNIDTDNKTSLEKLTQKVCKNLAQEVDHCWIDPRKIVLDKFLGHGLSLFL